MGEIKGYDITCMFCGYGLVALESVVRICAEAAYGRMPEEIDLMRIKKALVEKLDGLEFDKDNSLFKPYAKPFEEDESLPTLQKSPDNVD